MTRPAVLDRIGEGLVAGIPGVLRRRRRLRLAGVVALMSLLAGTGWLVSRDEQGTTETVFTAGGTPTPDATTATMNVPTPADDAARALATQPPFAGVAGIDPVIGHDEVFFVGQVEDDGVTVAYSLSLASGQWRQLPEPPEDFGESPAAVWTGSELVVCCGGAPDTSGTAAYDPTTDRWRPLPKSPLDSYADAVWTGDLMYVIDNEGFASFDPATETWSSLAPPPDLRGWPGELAWSGDGLFVWPRVGQRISLIGSRYDPGTDRWDQFPTADAPMPAFASIVTVGDELFVWGGLPGAISDDSERFVGIRWDGAWGALPDPLPEPDGCECNLGSQRALTVGERILVHVGALASGADPVDGVLLSFDPVDESWSELGRTFDTALVPLATDGQRVVFRRADGQISVVPVDAVGEGMPLPPGAPLPAVPHPAIDRSLARGVDLTVVATTGDGDDLFVTDLSTGYWGRYQDLASPGDIDPLAGVSVPSGGNLVSWTLGATTTGYPLDPSRFEFPRVIFEVAQPGLAIPAGSEERTLVTSPSGEQVWIVTDGSIAYYDFTTGEPPWSVATSAFAGVIAATERGLYVRSSIGDPNSEAVLVETESRSITRVDPPEPGAMLVGAGDEFLLWRSSTGDLLAHSLFARAPSPVYSTLTPPTGSAWGRGGVVATPSNSSPMRMISPEGQHAVISVVGDGSLEDRATGVAIVDLANGTYEQLDTSATGASHSVTWTHDGAFVVIFTDEDDGTGVAIAPVDTGVARPIPDAIPPGFYLLGAG